MPIQYDEHMSDADAIMWNNERDPMLRSTILSVIAVDREPDVPRIGEAVDRSLATIPRLRQHVVLDPLRAATPAWRVDEHFDLRYHLRHVALPGQGTMRDLLDLAEPIAMQAFDKDRPLWELYRVSGLEGGRAALLIKLHHAISDGVGLVRMTASLVERSPEPEVHPETRRRASAGELAVPEHGAFFESLHALRYRAETEIGRTARLVQALGRGARDLTADPVGTARSAAELAASVARTLRPVSEPKSKLMHKRSFGVRFAEIEYPLDRLKAAARLVDGTLNCVFVGGVTGGMRRYHEKHGASVETLRMTMPINVRTGEPGEHAGNQFSPARFEVPVALADPVERMRQIAAAGARERHEPALPLVSEVACLVGELPSVVAVNLMGSMLKAIDLVTSNVPGPPFPVYASGARVERMFGFGPLSGAASNITLFSYDGSVYIGVNTDPAAIPDADVFLECLRAGMEEVLAVAAE